MTEHDLRDNRPVKAFQRWIARFPAAYRESVLGVSPDGPAADDGPNRIATLRHYRSLVPMAMEARKPVFALKPADGAIGAHTEGAQRAFGDFNTLAEQIAERIGRAAVK
ncbi:MAG: hypothetical protein M3365_11380 [Gemmatimonadota bacterium]|nr:hypothetical protein [Gemmatimonadota bacterium]